MAITQEIANSVAEVIENNRAALQAAIGTAAIEDQTLAEQALFLIDQDNEFLRRLGTEFHIPSQESLPPHLKDVHFSSFLAEQLLRESSLLIDRCLQQRTEVEELNRKWFETRLQVQELLQLSEITKREESENYDLPEMIAKSEQDAISAENQQINVVLQRVIDGYKFLTDANATTELARFELAVANQFAFRQSNSDNALLLQLRKRSERERIPLGIQQDQQMVIKKVNEKKLEGAAENILLKRSLADFQIERNEVARLCGIRRAMQLVAPGGALNFREQMLPIKSRFDNDLVAAWLRIWAARKGFSELYQYPEPESNFPDRPYDVTIDFDTMVTWCQNTNTWLASFTNDQQQVTRSFGLSYLIGRDGREVEGEGPVRTWKFRLNEEDFFHARFVRMRGFALQVDSGNQAGSWNVSLTPPRSTIIRHKTFDSGNPVDGRADLEQATIGELYLGRVNERVYAVLPDNAAPPKIYNASPIGRDDEGGFWTISVLGDSTSGVHARDIRDLDIHLTVAFAKDSPVPNQN